MFTHSLALYDEEVSFYEHPKSNNCRLCVVAYPCASVFS